MDKIYCIIIFCLVSTTVFCQSQIGCTISPAGAVTISGDGRVMAVGQFSMMPNVQIFENIGGFWSQLGNDIDGNGIYCRAVSLSANGHRVAIGGEAIGATGSNDTSYVQIFEYNGGTWTQLGADIIGREYGNYFGEEISISADGNRVAIGEADWDYSADTGYARVFEFNNGNWTQIGQDIRGKMANDLFGRSVSLSSSGNRLAVGAPYNSGSFSGNRRFAGQVRVFEYISGSWTQIGSDINGESWNDESGTSVSLSGDGSRLAIGAPDAEADTGHVRIFEYNGGTWAQLGADIIGEVDGDNFGQAVSISADGSVVAIGTPNSGNPYISGSMWGHVRMLKYINGKWVQINRDILGAERASFSGSSVALSADGGIVAIGTNNHSGYARVYSNYVDPQWTQIGTDIDGESAEDESGNSVSLSADGSVVAIGAPTNDGTGNSAGHVRVFKNVGGNWTQMGADIDGEDWEDYSGTSVSLSADGSRVAIGARGNSGNGIRAGHVRVFEYNGGSWTQMGADIDGDDAGDEFGSCLSLSADGSRIAIGAPDGHRDNNGLIAGYIKIFEFNNGSWTQLGGVIDGEYGNYQIGNVLALSANGNRLVFGVGAHYFDTTFFHAYDYTNGNWAQNGNGIDGQGMGGASSVSLSADGNKVAIGTPDVQYGSGGDCLLRAGVVRVFGYTNGNWNQIGENLYGEASEDHAGSSVSLSADGNRLAVGAPWNNPVEIGGRWSGGGAAGHVRIFELVNGSWSKILGDIDGEDGYDASGTSVSLSADGSVVAIGAPGNNGNGESAGHVRVYGELQVPATTFFSKSDNHVRLFPNPTTGSINISLREPQGHISIMSIQGDVLKYIPVTQEEMQVDLASFANGLYLILIKQNGVNTAHRIILLD